MAEYKSNDDGSISKVETLTAEEAQSLIDGYQASIDGARASIAAYTTTKQAEIDVAQAQIDLLAPVVQAAQDAIEP